MCCQSSSRTPGSCGCERSRDAARCVPRTVGVARRGAARVVFCAAGTAFARGCAFAATVFFAGFAATVFFAPPAAFGEGVAFGFAGFFVAGLVLAAVFFGVARPAFGAAAARARAPAVVVRVPFAAGAAFAVAVPARALRVAGGSAGLTFAAGAGRAFVPTAPLPDVRALAVCASGVGRVVRVPAALPLPPAVRAFAVSRSGVGRALPAVCLDARAAAGAFAFAGDDVPPRRVS